MKHILLVTKREFIATVATRAFVIGLFVLPCIIGLFALVGPRLFNFKNYRIEGAVASEEVAANLLQVVVDHSLHLPGMFTIRLLNHDIKWLQDETFREGKKIEIFCGERSKFKLLSGKIASLEPDLDVAHPTLLVRGYDPSHKLYRGHAP